MSITSSTCRPTFRFSRAKLIKWFANLLALSGGAAMAVAPQVCLSPYTYVPFAISHIIWTIMAFRNHDKELMWLNVGVLCLDIWAIIVRL